MRCASSAVAASTITLTIGSVPDGRSSTRPELAELGLASATASDTAA